MGNEKRVKRLLRFEGARLLAKDFGGKKYGPSARSFGVYLTPEEAEDLKAEGWNVKHMDPREDDPDQQERFWLPVKVRFDPYPPVIVLISDGRKHQLDEKTVGQLDWTAFSNVDLVITPYNREGGVTAYLKEMFATKRETGFAEKYSDIPYADDEEMPFE